MFTPQEKKIIDRLVLGKSNKVIAHELKVKEATIKVHIAHIFYKLNVTNRTEAALALVGAIHRDESGQWQRSSVCEELNK